MGKDDDELFGKPDLNLPIFKADLLINEDDEDVESLTRSYNQKEKEDTNFLGRQKNKEELSRNDGATWRDTDILYNLQMRPSYD